MHHTAINLLDLSTEHRIHRKSTNGEPQEYTNSIQGDIWCLFGIRNGRHHHGDFGVSHFLGLMEYHHVRDIGRLVVLLFIFLLDVFTPYSCAETASRIQRVYANVQSDVCRLQEHFDCLVPDYLVSLYCACDDG